MVDPEKPKGKMPIDRLLFRAGAGAGAVHEETEREYRSCGSDRDRRIPEMSQRISLVEKDWRIPLLAEEAALDAEAPVIPTEEHAILPLPLSPPPTPSLFSNLRWIKQAWN